MLTIKKRQTYLEYLGYYTGKIDGKEGPLLKDAYKKLQQDYFVRKKDIDGIYGKDTDILLQNVYNVKKYTKNFDLKNDPLMKCGCGGEYCTGYPAVFDVQLLKSLQKIRDKYGPTTVTSGLRCKPYNDSLPGSSSTSRHMKGKAMDIDNKKTHTEAGRKIVMAFFKLRPKYNYTYCNLKGSHPNMGNSVHIDVK